MVLARAPIAAIVLLPALLACRPDPVVESAWIAPLHGQTGVARSADLRVVVGDLGMPPDYPLPTDFVRVVDLEQGGFVPGAIAYDGEDLRFRPDQPWLPDRRYVWSVGEVESLPRAPEYRFPDGVFGEAVFSTARSVEVLELTLDGDQVCAVLSQAVDDPSIRVSVTVDDDLRSSVGYDLAGESGYLPGLTLDDGDRGVSVACLTGIGPLQPGASVRIWWGDQPPFQAVLAEASVDDLILARRRAR